MSNARLNRLCLLVVFCLLLAQTAFAEFIPPNVYHVRPSDAVHKTINSVLRELKNLPIMQLNSNGYKIYVHNENNTPYRETVSLDARFPYVDLIGVPDGQGNKPIIDGSLGNPTGANPEEENTLNISMLNETAGKVHGFVFVGGVKTGVKITASDVEFYNNEVRDNGQYGISISFSYGPGATDPDSDGDGVKDTADSCGGTQPGASVNRNGCSAAQLSAGDGDNDGVPDSADKCPGTPELPGDTPPLSDTDDVYIPVNVFGCPYGNIHDNLIHDNPEWNINVYSNSRGTEGDFTTQPLIHNNLIYNSKVGITVRNELAPPDEQPNLNTRPTIWQNSIFAISGFSGNVSGTLMGAIAVSNHAFAKIIDNDITNVSRGIAFNGGSGEVFGNAIHNTTDPNYGDGISLGQDAFNVRIMNNLIYSNESNGIRFTATTGVEILNNTVDSNKRSGVLQAASGAVIRNNIFSFNGASGYLLNLNSSSNATYNDYWGNTAGPYGGYAQASTGDIYKIPMYVNGNNAQQGVVLNFHLRPSSELIDAGDPSDDCFNEPENQLTPGVCRINMGAYGNTYEATQPGSMSADSDFDGVFDRLDRCPGTPLAEHTSTDVNGCSPTQAVGDSDGDGVRNADDECPNTMSGVSVDQRGCGPMFGSDEDGDGTLDSVDRCPGTVDANVDAYGCGALQQNDDTDGDGVLDPRDSCPNTPNGVAISADGCPVNPLQDTDGDQVDDSLDRCPNTPALEQANLNGCSVSQLKDDLDNDGVFNNNDTCPNTPENFPVNDKGCPTSTLDSDSDGVSDADDMCPDTSTSEASEVSAVGCSPSQAVLDSDQDGVNDGSDLCPGTRPAVYVNENGCELPPGDEDGDTVSDAVDRCPGTVPAEAGNVGVFGCSSSQLEDDSDGDGVKDKDDLCPGTPSGAQVKPNGCVPMTADSDFDGISDLFDKCPNTPVGDFVVADSQGCASTQVEDDSDGDGVKDPFDECPATTAAAGVTIDSRGCVAGTDDADGDGVEDSFDRCPNTLSRDALDDFGCSAAQRRIDTDQDGVLDSVDRCSDTPPDSIVNLVGCIDPSRNDADKDGVVDRLDRCADTASGASVDAASYGCSQEQLDLDDDNDNVMNFEDSCLNTPAGDTVDKSGCTIATVDSIVLSSAQGTTENGIRLNWDAYTGPPSTFRGYYIYRSEDIVRLEELEFTIMSLLVPATTPLGSLLLVSLLFGAFFILSKNKKAGSALFGLIAIVVSSISINAAGVIAPENPYKKIADINTTTFLDRDVESGKKYYYRVFTITSEFVYQSNITNAVAPEMDVSPPVVVAMSPVHGAVNVPVSRSFSASFNEELDPSTVNANTITMDFDGGSVDGTVSYSGLTAVFTPISSLMYNTTYSFNVSGVKDLAGNVLDPDTDWNFTTVAQPGGSIFSSFLLSIDPAADADDVSLTSAVTVTFAEAMDVKTITPESFKVIVGGSVNIPGSITFPTNSVAVFKPAGLLVPNTTYRVTITTGARTTMGVSPPTNLNWSFKTENVAGVGGADSGYGFPAGIWSGKVMNGSNTVVNFSFSVRSTDTLGLPASSANNGLGGSPGGPGGNSIMLLSGTFFGDDTQDSRELSGLIGRICVDGATGECKGDGEYKTDEFSVNIQTGTGERLNLMGTLKLDKGVWRVSGRWITSDGPQWGPSMLFRTWSAEPAS